MRSFEPVLIPLALAAIGWIVACDNPQPPELCGSIPEQTIVVGESVSVDVCFDDPNGEMLDFRVFTSNPGVAAATATRNTVTATAIAPGTALVTMVATDPTGLKAQQSFRVVVPNRPPVAVGTIEDREVMVGDSVVLEVAGYFSEPDGQALSYGAAVSDSSRVAVSVDGPAVTVVAVAKGTVAVAVVATDPGGLEAIQSFQIKVPNRPPVPVDSITAREIMVERADTIDASAFFNDPDGDVLTYVAAVSDSAVASVMVSGSALTVAGVAKGEAKVTVTATDDEGLSAVQRFQVTVPNRPPVVTDTIGPRMLFKDGADTVDLAAHFSDPDGDALTWDAEASDSAVVAVELSATSSTLTVTALSQGEASVTVTATDAEGLTARQSFAVTVPNRPPITTDTIASQTLYKREAAVLDLAGHFTDPDGDVLRYDFASTDTLVATAAVEGTTLTVRAGAAGEATLTVTATDPGGLSARHAFTVTVRNRTPTVTDSIPALTIFRGRPHTVDLSAHFHDPDGDILRYTAESSNRRVVQVRITGNSVVLSSQLKGTAEVTVTATDPDDAMVQHTFDVTVGNQAPVPVGKLPDLTLDGDDRPTLSIADYFEDPDGDALTYGAETADPDIARATVRGTSVTVTGVSNGQTTLTLTATDPDGRTATRTARITVTGQGGNQGGTAPTSAGEIPAQTIAVGASRSLAVSGYFQDPNGDPLTFSTATGDPDVATASAAGVSVTLTGVAAGTTTLTVTATDPGGLSASLSASVTVVATGQGPVVVRSIPEQRPSVGQAITVSVAEHFQDPDGGSLSFDAVSSDPGVATASTSGTDVTLKGVSEGRTQVTVTATDSDGLTADQQFGVRVVELSPDLQAGSASVSASTVEPGGTFNLSVTVINAGEGESSATTLRYYRSSGGSDTQVGTSNVGPLAAGESSARSIDLPAPSTEGRYHYSACVDEVTGESDTTDNCSNSVQLTVESTRGIPARVEVTAPQGWAPVGGTVTYRARVLDSYGDPVAGARVSWLSSHPTIATVDANGVVTAIAVGEATVTATVSGSAGAAAQAGATTTTSPQAMGANVANARSSVRGSKRMHVVEPVARVELDPTSITLDSVGASQTLAAAIYDASDNEMEPTYWSWSSADRTVATVSSSLGSSTERATVYSVGAGETTVTFNANGTEGSASVAVTISGRRVEVSPRSLSFDALGQTKSVTVRVLDENGDEDEDATWYALALFSPCCEPNLADPPQGIDFETVDDGLNVTANGPGRGSISVNSNDAHNGVVQISVNPQPHTLTISPDSVNVAVGGTATLRATVTDANGHSIHVSGADNRGGLVLNWVSDDSDVATVATPSGSATATVTGVKTGTVTITARWGNTVTGTARVVVTAAGGSDDDP